RHLHRGFVHAGPLHLAADAVQLRPAVFLRAERRVPLRTPGDDDRHVAERLDVVDGGRLAVQPHDRGEWRVVARLRALAFQRFEQRGLFAGLVRAGAAVYVHVAVEAGSEDVLAEKAALVGLVDRALENHLHVVELTPYVDVGDFRADRVAAD